MSSDQLMSSYAVDIVFCIDCTGSMGPYLDSVKRTARQFEGLLRAKMAEKDKGIRQLRVRIIEYRDLGEEGPDRAIVTHPFFKLPEQATEFDQLVASLVACGGGDEPESALEAIAVAIRSPWERGLDKRRHILVVCTDASAHPLGRFKPPSFLSNVAMPTTLEELQALWGDDVDEGEMEFAAKRLLIFAPDMYPWGEMTSRFENCVYVPSVAEAGMQESDQDMVLGLIAGSV
jgi:hypothetical protein